ncbi:glutathione peroxidase [Pseudoalteromonas lipolytica]|jgi:glutathione peroxidase|uniref:Glutathione peroxidase n=2 Tax=Pseudoalteromonas TaxID=53246 RepID=A0AAD0RX42_9GAMM|nr:MULTISPECIES: glutathione peroxidase [Pseudoalteromonas]AXV64275.1 glutathione peroxidase [Pseudoalteromonas donghaensis]MBE0352058.1 glutathione peroxidase [Pseudoalteromonas lipolytica LMEB 39]MCC9662477.1 glutathione peroxidase [Pseudoalteromonas sp. MB41]QPL43362.1 glutathione peroxidase [Pseudoalteromonas sp. A41-2]SFT57590.1 glutathione peroxidase [Pseudoalteromonas lipolytica]
MNKYALLLCASLMSTHLAAESPPSIQDPVAETQCDDFTNVTLRKLRSKESVNLCEFKGKPLLIVNTASNCGFTPQFEGLEAIHKEYKDRGLVVLGFPSDDFFQEEDDEKDTAKVCYINYGVTFTMFATSAVRGSDANPIFKHLNEATSSPNWNFYKYIVSADRKTVERFNSKTKPESKAMRDAIEAQLAAK